MWLLLTNICSTFAGIYNKKICAYEAVAHHHDYHLPFFGRIIQHYYKE